MQIELLGGIMKIELFSGLFWGILLMIGGVLFILRNYVNINIPIFRILFGLLLIYWGLSIIFGGFVHTDSHSAVFTGNQTLKLNEKNNEYNIIFGSGEIDLTDYNTLKRMKKIEVNAIFGQAIVIVPDNVTIRLDANAVFGEAKTPQKTSVFIGESNGIINQIEGSDEVEMEVNAIFGSVEVREVHVEIPRPETARDVIEESADVSDSESKQ